MYESKYSHPAINFIDLTGQQFGLWTVIRRDTEKEQKYKSTHKKAGTAQWICKCQCGLVRSIPTGNLRQGKSKGCPKCTAKTPSNYIDLTGQKFGMLTVIKRYNQLKRGKYWITKWVCQCECGNYTVVSSCHLRSGHTQSCGCLSSQYERKVTSILLENNILYDNEIGFDDLRTKEGKNQRYRFDYGIYENDALSYIIEVDGQFHFKNFFDRRLENQHKNDMIKNNYCFDNNIRLLRIPYTEVGNLTIDDLLYDSSKYKLTRENVEQYYINNGLELEVG